MTPTRAKMLRKAAIVVASLESADADALLDRLSEADAAVVRRMLVELDDPASVERQAALDEFVRAKQISRPSSPGEQAGDRVEISSTAIESLAGALGRGTSDDAPFRFLHEASGEKITPFLAGEHPQTIAVVISHLPPERAAEAMATLPAGLQSAVLKRLADLDEADPETLREVERGLAARLSEHVRIERRRAAGLRAVVDILEASKPAMRRQLLAGLARYDRQLARKLDPPQVEFSDLERWDAASLRSLWRLAGGELVALALAGATVELAARWQAALPAAESRELASSMTSLGPLRLSDVEEAQSRLAALAVELVLEERPERHAMLAGAAE